MCFANAFMFSRVTNMYPRFSDDTNIYGTRSSINIFFTLQGTYPWTPSIQGIILGSYFYGYVAGQIIGGYLADYLGAKHLFGCATLLSSIVTCLTPAISALPPKYLIALRVLMGLIHVSANILFISFSNSCRC